MTQVGLSTALGIDHLPLLPSGPDGVRGFPPRRARLSTSNCGHWPVAGPLRGIQPCCSGLQVQGTASSPPSTTNFIIASQLLHCQTKRAHDFTNRHQNTANETKVYYLPLATLSRKALIESRVPSCRIHTRKSSRPPFALFPFLSVDPTRYRRQDIQERPTDSVHVMILQVRHR